MAALVDPALIVLCGPTASGKTALALALAERFSGEIVSCDSVAVYRGMEIGTAKPTPDERARVPHHLIDILTRLDLTAAALIHANDSPKIIRAIEVTLAARRPITQQWQQPRDALTGYRVLRLGLNPPRADLYARINRRAYEMFDRGLVDETTQLVETYGFDCRALTSLGYAQAIAVLRNQITREEAVALAAQGHRNYAKRQLTWFRKDPLIHWLPGFGSDGETIAQAKALVANHLAPLP